MLNKLINYYLKKKGKVAIDIERAKFLKRIAIQLKEEKYDGHIYRVAEPTVLFVDKDVEVSNKIFVRVGERETFFDVDDKNDFKKLKEIIGYDFDKQILKRIDNYTKLRAFCEDYKVKHIEYHALEFNKLHSLFITKKAADKHLEKHIASLNEYKKPSVIKEKLENKEIENIINAIRYFEDVNVE